jgi:hypothetical protein
MIPSLQVRLDNQNSERISGYKTFGAGIHAMKRKAQICQMHFFLIATDSWYVMI